MRYILGKLSVFALATVPCTAFAEVMDKEPSVGQVWLLAIPVAFIAFFACRFKPWFAVLTLPLPLLYIGWFISEALDPSVGPAILAEAGWSYFVACALAFVVVVAAHILGVMAWHRRRPTRPPSGSAETGR